MKKIFKIIFIIIVIGAIAGYIYWQQNKKRIIREAIESAIQKKTDSLYYIHYDSSRIDEINGNASFYNVSLQSDSAQKKILASTDSLPNALYFITVNEVRASGVDMAGLLQNTNVAAGKILLIKPRIQIINTGADKPKPFTAQDTLELYQKILGKFKSIKADTIQVANGAVIITNRQGKPLTTLENINIDLKNFLVDSIHNYENIVSYFIKDISASVENIQLPESKNNTRINMTKLAYDAAKKTLQVKEIQQYKTNSTQPLIDLKNINITQLNTDAFIVNQQLKAGMITCEGGLIT
jgi:ribosomal protein S5